MPPQRITFEGKEYYAEVSLLSPFGLASVRSFRDKFPGLRYCHLSANQRRQLVESGAAPKSFNNASKAVMVLCEDVDPLFEQHGIDCFRSRSRGERLDRSSSTVPPVAEIITISDDVPTSKVNPKQRSSVLSDKPDFVQELSSYSSASGTRNSPSSETLAFVCETCPLYTEFSDRESFFRHYNSAHLSNEDDSHAQIIEITSEPSVKIARIEVSHASGFNPSRADNSLFFDSDNNPLTCKICQNKHGKFQTLRQHRTAYRHWYMSYYCPHCPQIYGAESLLDRHLSLVHHGLGKGQVATALNYRHNCPIDECYSVYRSGTQLVSHINEQHPGDVYICKQCFATFQFRKALETHLKASCMSVRPTNLPKGYAVYSNKLSDDTDDEMVSELSVKTDWSKCELCEAGVQFTCPIVALHHKQTQHPEAVLPTDARVCQRLKWSALTIEVKGYTRFICKLCNRIFSSRASVRSHELSHIGITSRYRKDPVDHMCTLCNQVFPSLPIKRSHVAAAHSCDVCQQSFFKESDFRAHQRDHTELPRRKRTDGSELICVSCDICHQTFSNERRLFSHKKTHIQRKPPASKRIQRKYQQSARRIRAKKPISVPTRFGFFECSRCGKLFKTVYNLRSHQKQPCSRSDYQFTCEICSNLFKTRLLLYNHMRLFHPEDEATAEVARRREMTRHECEKCGAIYSSRHYLVLHQQRPCDRRDRLFTCEICSSHFKTKLTLGKHMAMKHPEIDRTKLALTCDLCALVLSDLVSFQEHIDKHDQPDALERRSRRKEKKKEYKCDICGKLMYARSTRITHMAMHRGDRRFKCSKCGKSYYRKVDLNNHASQPCDPADYKFRCELCDDIFKTAFDLDRHVRKLHPEKDVADYQIVENSVSS